MDLDKRMHTSRTQENTKKMAFGRFLPRFERGFLVSLVSSEEGFFLEMQLCTQNDLQLQLQFGSDFKSLQAVSSGNKHALFERFDFSAQCIFDLGKS